MRVKKVLLFEKIKLLIISKYYENMHCFIKLMIFISTWTAVKSKMEQETVHLTIDVVSRILPKTIECINQTGINFNELLIDMQSKVLRDDEDFKNFLYCSAMKLGVANGSGHLIGTKIMAMFPKDVKNKSGIIKALEECNKEIGKDPRSTVHKVSKCFYKTSPVVFTF